MEVNPWQKAWGIPFRAPVMHLPDDVTGLRRSLREGLDAATAAGETREIEWFRADIEKLAGVMDVAIEGHEALISVLEPPMDEERAVKVRIPFALGAKRSS